MVLLFKIDHAKQFILFIHKYVAEKHTSWRHITAKFERPIRQHGKDGDIIPPCWWPEKFSVSGTFDNSGKVFAAVAPLRRVEMVLPRNLLPLRQANAATVLLSSLATKSTVSGVADVTLRFGGDTSDLPNGAFADAVSEKIFEDTNKGFLAQYRTLKNWNAQTVVILRFEHLFWLNFNSIFRQICFGKNLKYYAFEHKQRFFIALGFCLLLSPTEP